MGALVGALVGAARGDGGHQCAALGAESEGSRQVPRQAVTFSRRGLGGAFGGRLGCDKQIHSVIIDDAVHRASRVYSSIRNLGSYLQLGVLRAPACVERERNILLEPTSSNTES